MNHPEMMTFGPEYWAGLAPHFALLAGITVLTLATVTKGFSKAWVSLLLSLATLIVALGFTLGQLGAAPAVLFKNGMAVDGFSAFLNLIFIGCGIGTILSSFRYLDRDSMQIPEYYLLILLSILGMMFLVSSLDFIVLFIALELMSLTVYTLVGFRRADRLSNEASMKYFILGGAASAVFLYGVALLYGATGSTSIRASIELLQSGATVLPAFYFVGLLLVMAGFLFKVATVPFHSWMPDVYEGAPTPITGFMTTAIKVASFGAFVRVLSGTGFGKGLLPGWDGQIYSALWWLCVATLVLGNFVALSQTNLKRMLAYSSIAHTGYLMMGLITAARNELGYAPVIFYLLSYAVMNLGAFGSLALLSGPQDRGLTLSDLSGLAQRRPWIAFSLAVFLFSMAGIPPTAGFVSKYYLFAGAVQAGEIPLVVIAVLCSAASVYYYLRVLVHMYMKESAQGAEVFGYQSRWAGFAVVVLVILTLQLFLMPTAFLELAKKAVGAL